MKLWGITPWILYVASLFHHIQTINNVSSMNNKHTKKLYVKKQTIAYIYSHTLTLCVFTNSDKMKKTLKKCLQPVRLKLILIT